MKNQNNNITYYDFFPHEKDAMMGVGAPPGENDMVFVMGAPTPKRNNTFGNQVVGQATINLIEQAWAEAMGNEVGPDEWLDTHYTYGVKYPVKFKKKISKALLRQYEPSLLKEIRLALYGHTEYEEEGIIKRVLVTDPQIAGQLCPNFKNITSDHGVIFFNPTIPAYVIPTHPLYKTAQSEPVREMVERDLYRFFTILKIDRPEFTTVEDMPMFQKNSEVFLDIETTGLDPFVDEITQVGWRASYQAEVRIMENPTVEQLLRLVEQLKSSGSTVIMHNGQFDAGFITRKTGFDWRSMNIKDTMLIAHVQGKVVKNLKHLTTMHTMRPGPHAFGGFDDPAYLAEDVLSTEEVYNAIGGDTYDNQAIRILHDILPHFIQMRYEGVYFEHERLEEIYPDFASRKWNASRLLEKTVGREINWNSSQQVVELFLENKIPLTAKTPAGKFSVSEPVIESFKGKFPLVDQILDYRFHTKQLTFLDSYKELSAHTGLLHPKMILTGTDTGRLSCRKPNLQQVPRTGTIKTIFKSRWAGGMIGLIDLSQAELRVAALLANDDMFAEALLSEDVHRKIASMIWDIPMNQVTIAQRKKSKGITFGLLYGGSDWGLASKMGITAAQVKTIRKKFLETFPGLARYLKAVMREATTTGVVTTPFGRVRDIARIAAREGHKGAMRKATNTPIQGTASDIMLFIDLKVMEMLYEQGSKSKVIFGVHDSGLLDIHPDDMTLVPYTVQQAFLQVGETPLGDMSLWNKLDLPGELVIARSWAEVESTNEAYDTEKIVTYDCSTHLKGNEVVLAV